MSVNQTVLREEPEPVASAQYSWGGEMTLVHTIVETLASATGQSPEDLPPLHNAVDVDALESIFGPRGNGQHRAVTGEISFLIEEHEVVVKSHGRVLVRSAE
ncbi:HalOD1 output domain-containing protein [Haladaptatus cibarius]|uniref:HalOD1 output domain-containing protein n=1 Tax=Haladaptatus cibarius TaxID=453847 RepID=UPI0006785CDD|nr:HalOD1 output domain-containing protein [Haladaptatus cibarius]